jgi:hypothetical protein
MFRGKCINCQADVIRQYVKQGRRSIMNDKDVKELNDIFREFKKQKRKDAD